MKKAKVVIGGGYGDEGKGLFTDYFAEQIDSDLVVRFNGGAQAGHTVHRNGMRHVFSHFGSGALLGVPTFLTQDFVVNPIKFRSEREELLGMFVSEPKVWIDWRAPMTTPWDIMLNQAKERMRGGERHGSCGAGINETVTRSQYRSTNLTISDLLGPDYDLQRKVGFIRDHLSAEMTVATQEDFRRYFSIDVLQRYIEDLVYLKNSIWPGDESVLRTAENIVFEGAQGLRLDQYNKLEFPHVTRSSTGLRNVTRMIWDNQLDRKDVEVVYLTRCYVTRHGAGPLTGEKERPTHVTVVDDTNVDNPHQGTLRFADLDLLTFLDEVQHDIGLHHLEEYTFSLGVTHLDHMEPGPRGKLIDDIHEYAEAYDFAHVYQAYGKTAKDVYQLLTGKDG